MGLALLEGGCEQPGNPGGGCVEELLRSLTALVGRRGRLSELQGGASRLVEVRGAVRPKADSPLVLVFAERETRRFHHVLVLSPGLPELLVGAASRT